MQDSLAIRFAEIDDAAELARLISPLGYPISQSDVLSHWESWSLEGNFALILEGEGNLIGVVTLHKMTVLHRPKAVGRITSLFVDPAARGRGFGRALMRAAEEEMIERGCGILEVTSHARRNEAHEFYRHFGYEQTSFRFAKIFG